MLKLLAGERGCIMGQISWSMGANVTFTFVRVFRYAASDTDSNSCHQQSAMTTSKFVRACAKTREPLLNSVVFFNIFPLCVHPS